MTNFGMHCQECLRHRGVQGSPEGLLCLGFGKKAMSDWDTLSAVCLGVCVVGLQVTGVCPWVVLLCWSIGPSPPCRGTGATESPFLVAECMILAWPCLQDTGKRADQTGFLQTWKTGCYISSGTVSLAGQWWMC